MLKMFSINNREVDHVLPPGWIDGFATSGLAEKENGYLYRDNGPGENIAPLNPSFCELSAHYWVWKNLKGADYVGFCHHRRYFNFIDHPQMALPKLLAQPTPEIMQFVAQEAQKEQVLKILQTTDVITTRQYCLGQTISAQFCESHPSYIWDEFIRAIQEVSPEWLSKYLPWFDVSREFHFYPVFIMPWATFDEFCTLLFDVLFLVYQRIGLLDIDPENVRFQNRRYPAFLSERFMMLYFHAKGLRLHGAQLIALEATA